MLPGKTRFFLLFLAVLTSLTWGCQEKKSVPDISKINIESVHIKRYDQALFKIDPDTMRKGLDDLYPSFSFFLGDNYTDTLNLVRISNFLDDPMIRDLEVKTNEVYPSLSGLEGQLTDAFRFWKYYYPEDTIPEVYSYISGLYYEAPIEYYDSVLIISLDLYLGQDFEPYRAIGLPHYMVQRMTPEFIVPDCMKQIGMAVIPPNLPERTLLDQMVLQGKLLYFLDLVLPGTPDTLKSGFTSKQEQWCLRNEGSVWALMIDKDLLFSPDPFVIDKFIQDAPFTSGLPEESPGMIGKWIGWRIIRAFMKENPGIDIHDLFALKDSQEILSRSKYKPER